MARPKGGAVTLSGFDISMVGTEELRRAFSEASDHLQKEILVEAFKEAAAPIADKAQANAPVETGKLRSTIRVTKVSVKRSRVQISIRTGTRAEMGIARDSKGYYPAHVELGYKRGKRVFPGKAYLRRAFREAQPRVLQLLKDKIREGLVAAFKAKTGAA